MGIISKIKNVFGNGIEEYEVLKVDNKWKFQKAKADRSIRNFDSKNDAVNYAKEYFGKHTGELVIHKEDGSVQEKRTYEGQEV